MAPLSTSLSLFAALLFGAGDFCGGLAGRIIGLRRTLLATQLAGAVLLLALAIVASTGALSLADLGTGALAGLSAAAGLAALYRGLSDGIVAVVAPVSALLAAAVPALLGALLGERPSSMSLIGVTLCLPAVAVLSWESGGAKPQSGVRSSLLLGAVAGLFLGVFYAAISRMRAEAGLWPLFLARAMSLLVVAVYFVIRRCVVPPRGRGRDEPPEPPRAVNRGTLCRGIAAALAGGALDASGNATFLVASRSGPLVLVSVVTSLYPALTVLLARLFFGQRIGARRFAGLALALAGVVLIGLR